MKKAVLEIMDYAAAYRGNFLTSMLSLADELKKHDVETVFVFPERARQREWSAQLFEEGYIVTFMPDSFLSAVKLLKSVFGQYDFLAVHSHFLRSNMYLPLRIVNFFSKVPHYFHAHSMPKQTKKDYKTLIRRFLLSADSLLCVSNGVAEKYRELGFESCITVKNSICFQRLDEYKDIDKESFRHGRKHSVLMFGYDFYIKGIDTAIDALDKYDTEHNIMLCICVASQKEKAVGYIENRFGKIPDWIKILPPRNDVASYMRSADVFLSASRTEGFAYAAVEAAYCGTAVALSDITAHSELAIPEAVMFTAGDGQDLYRALLTAFELGQTDVNRLYAKENFSMEKWLSKMCSILMS